jgi:phage terminase large subunit
MEFEILPQFKSLIKRDSNYKFYVYYGGRGGGKTIGIATCVILLCLRAKEYFFCGREIQKANDDSIAQVVKSTLLSLIEKGYISKNSVKIQKESIEFANGSFIKFIGFSDVTIDNIKSTPCTGVWVDEAHSLSKNTIDILRPSARTPNSLHEQPILIFSLNRKLINDPIIIESNNRTDCLVVKMNYYNNPWFNSNLGLYNELKQDEVKLKNNLITKSEFNNIWLGEPYIDEETLLSIELINSCKNYKCHNTHLYLPTFGLDIADEGKDSSVLTIVQGNKLLEQVQYRNIDSNLLAEKVIKYYDYYNSKEDIYNKNKIKIYYDLTGIGCGFRDAMRNRNYEYAIIGIRGNDKPTDDRYFNKRAECYGNLKSMFLDGFELINDLELIEQLAYIPIDLTKQTIKLVDKLKIKSKLGCSPDKADSLALAFSCMSNRLRINSFTTKSSNSYIDKKNYNNDDLTNLW